jgi:hypothetical protein
LIKNSWEKNKVKEAPLGAFFIIGRRKGRRVNGEDKIIGII